MATGGPSLPIVFVDLNLAAKTPELSRAVKPLGLNELLGFSEAVPCAPVRLCN